MLLKIDDPTEVGYEFCKTYIERFDSAPRLWNYDDSLLEEEVKAGDHDREYIYIPENMNRWIFLIIAERYIEQYEEQRKRTIVLPFSHKTDNSMPEGEPDSQHSVNIAGDGAVSSKGQVSGSGHCVETRSSHITCRRRSQKRPTARRLRRRSSKARKARKSRATRRK